MAEKKSRLFLAEWPNGEFSICFAPSKTKAKEILSAELDEPPESLELTEIYHYVGHYKFNKLMKIESIGVDRQTEDELSGLLGADDDDDDDEDSDDDDDDEDDDE